MPPLLSTIPHLSPLHDSTAPPSPSYTLPPSPPSIIHDVGMRVPHDPMLIVSPSMTSHDVGGSSSMVDTHPTSPLPAGPEHVTPTIRAEHLFGTPPSCPVLRDSSHGKSLFLRQGHGTVPMWLSIDFLMIWMWHLSLVCFIVYLDTLAWHDVQQHHRFLAPVRAGLA